MREVGAVAVAGEWKEHKGGAYGVRNPRGRYSRGYDVAKFLMERALSWH